MFNRKEVKEIKEKFEEIKKFASSIVELIITMDDNEWRSRKEVSDLFDYVEGDLDKLRSLIENNEFYTLIHGDN